MEKLAACPFCGSKAEFFETLYEKDFDKLYIHFIIKCIECGAEIPNARGHIDIALDGNGELISTIDDREEAIKKWNKRA